jgi:hypothetical protein
MDGTTWGDSDILQKTFLATEGDDILSGGRGIGDDTYFFADSPVLSGGALEGSGSVYLKTGFYACA